MVKFKSMNQNFFFYLKVSFFHCNDALYINVSEVKIRCIL